MAEARGSTTRKGREAAAESWPRGAAVMGTKLPLEELMSARTVFAEALVAGRDDR